MHSYYYPASKEDAGSTPAQTLDYHVDRDSVSLRCLTGEQRQHIVATVITEADLLRMLGEIAVHRYINRNNRSNRRRTVA